MTHRCIIRSILAGFAFGWPGLLPRIAAAEEVPVASASIARFRVAEGFLLQENLAAAEAACAEVIPMKDIPAHHRWEAEERIREIKRLQAGLPARDPTASRTPMPKRPTPAIELSVATDGNDAHPGTKDRPFATLHRAAEEIRRVKQRDGLPAGGVAVNVRGGQYKVTETFKLGSADSGTESSPIVYRASAGEVPIFTGGVQLTEFQAVQDQAVLGRLPEEARGKVMQVDLKTHGVESVKPLRLGGFAGGLGFKTHPTPELFFDKKAMQLARWPNDGYVRVVDVTLPDDHKIHGRTGSKTGRFLYEADRPNRWKDEKEILLYGYWFFGWADSYERVAGIDTDKREIILAAPYHRYGYRKGQPYYALNLLSEIDTPGEWYLDRGTSILYLYPPSNPNKAVVELSRMQAPMVDLESVSHVTFEGLLWEVGCGDAVLIKGGRRCLLAGCAIRHFGGNGVEIRGGTEHGVLSCDIHSMGRGGTVVSGGDRKSLTPGRHFIENCHIHNLSRIDHTYTPAVLMSGVGNRIAHNLMHNVRSSAIRLGGNEHLVQFNEVYDVVWESDDQGGADMFGNPTYRGNAYRYNYWHHIGGGQGDDEQPACGRAGIRLDDAICGVLLYGNVFYRCAAGRLGFGGIQIHGGKENMVDNNVFVDCTAAISFSPWGEARWKQTTANALQSPEIDRPLYLKRYPRLARLSEDHDVNTVSRSLVYRCDQFLLRDRGRTRLMDNLVTAEDPGFADAKSGIFQLNNDAAMSGRIGFRPIPFGEIGLYRDAYRTALPADAVAEARATESPPR